ncbi:unnamed protein product [Acanthosepion pharaonis]|uniref:SLC26A/SulP transporter domain-containing protein n=1 Tax=Acanthosepion pharaonis TaxID=158019 RepID=A0A812BHW7_ACAPH|nr:unnamed protein product [Sepia pharaonis]
MPDSYETHKTPIPLTQEFFETCRKEKVPVSCKTQMKKTVSKTYNYTTEVFRHILPVVHLIRNYELKSFLANDIIGGLTVSFMQLPQGMAYAIVADLPVEVGLFMGFFPVICYFIFGSSKHLSFEYHGHFAGFLSLPRTLYAIILQLPNLHYPVLLLSLITIFIIYIIKSQINERFKYRLRIPVPIDLIMLADTIRS